MLLKQRFLKCKKGLEPITAVFMLLIVFAAIVAIIFYFSNYNNAIQTQAIVEKEHSQEKIVISQIDVDNAEKIANISIRNTGTIEVRIRALYQSEDGEITFLADPSTFADTSVGVGEEKTINVTSLGLTVDPNIALIAATQRGTRSMEINEIELEYGSLPADFDTSQLSIGPIMLDFNSINYTKTDKNGNPTGSWPGWPVPSNTYCKWTLNVTNVDPEKRDLVIDKNTGLTLSKVGGPQATTWYLSTNQQTLAWNKTSTITFLWDVPGGNSAARAGSNQAGENNIFLTFFGNYTGVGVKFAQTIPFEAVAVS
jgi:hypothetical protein